MVFPDSGGGGSTRVLDQLNPLYNDIANLLGELAGNEAYLATLEANFPTTYSTENPMKIPQPDHTRLFTAEFTFPGTYGFTMQHGYWGADGTPEGGTTPPIETEKEIARLAKEAWDQAKEVYSEAYGTVSSFRSIGQNVWEPDPSAMSLAVDQLTYFAGWLQDQQKSGAGWVTTEDAAAPTWLVNLKKGWPATSQSSDSFYDFWDDVDDKCDHYLDIAARLTSTAAQATATISDFQANLLEVTQKTKDHVVLALKQWQTWKGPSGVWGTGKYDDNSEAKTILGGVSYGTGVIAMFPPASVISGSISVVTGGLSYLIPDKTEIMKATSAAKAFDIWSGYNSDVESVCTRMREALDAVHTNPPGESDLHTGSQGFDAYVKMVRENRTNWEPRQVNL